MRIALIGYGKMGKTIESLLQNKDQVSHRINSQNAEQINQINSQNTDVAIDFSHPDAAFENISILLNNGVKVVSGTTAWLDHIQKVHSLCDKNQGAFLYASNFSIGVNLFLAMTRYTSQLMAKHPDYQVDMTEIHHIHKIDAPSGTAISLADEIINVHAGYTQWTQQDQLKQGSLHIKSIREGEVPGTHKIRFASTVDEIEIVHQASSREGFAKGAIYAARWIQDKSGIFSMKDVLNID